MSDADIAAFVRGYADLAWHGKVRLPIMDDYDPAVVSGAHHGIQQFIAAAMTFAPDEADEVEVDT